MNTIRAYSLVESKGERWEENFNIFTVTTVDLLICVAVSGGNGS